MKRKRIDVRIASGSVNGNMWRRSWSRDSFGQKRHLEDVGFGSTSFS